MKEEGLQCFYRLMGGDPFPERKGSCGWSLVSNDAIPSDHLIIYFHCESLRILIDLTQQFKIREDVK
jgi:hypothetical protein